MDLDREDQPFTLPINVRTLPKKGQNVPYLADNDVRAHIAQTYDLISVESFKAHAVLAPWKRDGVEVRGTIDVQLTQPCAISGEPLSVRVQEDLEALFVPEGSRLSKPRKDDEGELIFDVEGDDLPDTFTGDSIDVAAVWLEFFGLGLDPFARIEGAELDVGLIDDPEDSPFAALAALKQDAKKH